MTGNTPRWTKFDLARAFFRMTTISDVTLPPLPMAKVRAAFIRRGTTYAEFARSHGFNQVTAHRAILGIQSGPKHQAVRKLIERELGLSRSGAAFCARAAGGPHRGASPSSRPGRLGPGQVVKTRFPGIVEAAASLNVSRIHLYYVLTGKRRSPRIECHPIFRVLQSKGRAA